MQKNTNQTHKTSHVLCINLLNAFTSAELEKLQKFVASPYHNTDKYQKLLLDFLIKKIVNKVDFDDEHQINTYNKIFSKKLTPKSYLLKEKRRLFEKMNKLMRLAEKFLVFESLVDNQSVYYDFLFTKLKEKDQKKLLLRHFKKIQNEIEQREVKNLPYYELKYCLQFHHLQFLNVYTESFEQMQTGLAQLSYYADMVFMLRKTDIFRAMVHSYKLNPNDEYFNMELITKLARQKKYEDNPYIKANMLVIKLFRTKNDEYYNLLLDFIEKQQSAFLKTEMNNLYTFLSNYCIEQNNSGVNMLHELFSLNQIAEKNKIIFENGEVSIRTLKHIIGVACKTAHFNWAQFALDKYKSLVEKNIRNSVYNFNLCAIAYYKKEYEKALSYAIKVNEINLDYDKNCKIMILKCHYELDEEYDERTLRIFRSAEKYLKTMKLLNRRQKKMYANFMNIFINLYKIKHRAGRLTLATIEKRLQNQTINSDKHWLLSKIEELKKI